MSDFKKAVLRVAAENPEFRRALKTEMESAARATAKRLLKGKRASMPKHALAKLSPEHAEWFKSRLRGLAKKLGGRVLKDTNTSFWFTYPKNPAVKRVVFTQIDRDRPLFWIVNQDGEQGTGWDDRRRVIHDPSNHVNLKSLFSKNPKVWNRDFNTAMNNSLEIDLKNTFFSESSESVVTDVVERRDLKPSSRGWNTGPNIYSAPTYYEVQGIGLNPATEIEVLKWLKSNKPGLLPGTHEYGYGAYDEVSLSWDRRENAWIIVKRFTYTGG